jgi:hypothetical protein
MVPLHLKDKEFHILSAQSCCTPLAADMDGDEVLVE